MRLPLIVTLVLVLAVLSCGSPEDEDENGLAPDRDLPDLAARGNEGDDVTDDDADDSGDDDTFPPVTPNPNAKADAFRLFYRERALRANLSFNRHALAGDAVAATAIGKDAIARSGDAWEVVPGPSDNNPIGKSVFNTWKLYRAIGGRELELTLIRMFEGLAFSEAVTGHFGLTVREALPGWTRTMDGVSGTVTRTNGGVPVAPPTAYPAALESEILAAFYGGVVYTYREDPLEYYYGMKAINELEHFAVTLVFSDTDALPDFLRISDCCSSWRLARRGPWADLGWWGNHNSRDNFTDYVMGYFAAFEAEKTPGLPDDLALAATHAADAARRVGDATVAHGNVLMTVDEWHDYDTLTPAGTVGPDGHWDWQDLGSLSSCQMAYNAQALSSEGLHWPVPEIPLPGAIEVAALRDLFARLGLDLPVAPMSCKTFDDAFVGMGWGDLMDLQLFGMPWYEVARLLAVLQPDLFYDLFHSLMDDFGELELGAVGLCYYAQVAGDPALLGEARDTLWHLIRLQRILAELVYGLASDPERVPVVVARDGAEAVAETAKDAAEMFYVAAAYARTFGIDAPVEDFDGFGLGLARGDYFESYLRLGDTAPWPMKSDAEIRAIIDAELPGRDPWIQERYLARFADAPPVRRAGDGYECIGPDGNWRSTENPHHVWLAGVPFWFEATLCVDSPETLDCSWARRGCAPADLDAGGAVDAADAALLDAAWETFGEGAACTEANSFCDGADVDGSGVLDSEDRDYLAAAQGCTTNVRFP
jgi:hypothetical protein